MMVCPSNIMGLNTKQTGKYITIFGGKFCMRVNGPVEGSVERINKLGNTVHEMFYDSFTGILVDIKTKDSQQYGKSWEFVFEDEGEQYTLQLSYSNSFATNILKMLPNVDLSQPFTLSPSQKMEDGKNKTSLFINQGGKAIKHAYNKENPNGLPPMVKIKVKGQDTWDDTDRLVFLQNMVDTEILPKLHNMEYKGTKESEDDVTVDVDGEDSPF